MEKEQIMKVKVGDIVFVNSGKHKGAKGRIVRLQPLKGRVMVDGVNLVVRNTKNEKAKPGTRTQKHMGIDRSNVQLFCETCKKGVRHYVKKEEQEKKLWDGSASSVVVKKRFCHSCDGEIIWVKALDEVIDKEAKKMRSILESSEAEQTGVDQNKDVVVVE